MENSDRNHCVGASRPMRIIEIMAAYLLVALLWPLFTSCSDDVPGPEEIRADVEASGFRVLAIGNSFTDNATMYLPELVATFYPEGSVSVVKAVLANSSLQTHWENHESDARVYALWSAYDGRWCQYGEVTIDEAIEFAGWDMVIVQQVSSLSGDPESFQPYLGNLRRLIARHHPDAALGWQMTWAYASSAKRSAFAKYDNNRQTMYHAIEDALGSLDGEVDFVIPSGRLIEMMRDTELNDDLDLTADGFHLKHGLPSYALSCLWHEVCIKPHTGVSSLGNTLRPQGDGISVTDEAAAVVDDLIDTVLNDQEQIDSIDGRK